MQVSLYIILVPLFFVVASVGVTNTAGFSLAMQKQGKNAGSASALLGVLSLALGAIAAPLVGLGGEHTAIPMGIVIVCAGVGAVFSFFCSSLYQIKQIEMKIRTIKNFENGMEKVTILFFVEPIKWEECHYG